MPAATERKVEVARIIDLAHDGRGVARLGGKTVFVHDALPGELVEVERTRRQRRYDEARLTRVLEASSQRVTPGCPHFGICGGCVLQHAAPERQLEHKSRLLLENLSRIGHVEPESVLPPLCSSPWGYRRRARLGAKWVARKERALVGFRERGSNFLADIEACPILAPPVDRLIAPLAELIGGLTLRARIPQIEVAVADNATAFVVRVLDAPTPADQAACAGFARTHGVRVYLQPGGYETVTPLTGGEGDLEYALPEFDLDIAFGPTDFVQINAELNRQMVRRAVDLLDPAPDQTVLDLFCGIGNFSLPLARRAGAVVGVEGDPALVERAHSNARRNGITNASFFTADLAVDPGAASWTAGTYARVLLDPPRAGAQQILPLLRRFEPTRLVYISCHPGSLARDAGALVNGLGFRLIGAGVMDMFPHTAHVESIAVFEPR